MKVLVLTLLVLFLSQGVYSACDDGYYEAAANYDGNICYQCIVGCNKCEDATSCSEWMDGLQGVETGNPITMYCMTGGYNPDTGRCENCMEGCSACLYDYDACTNCKGGWQFNRNGLSCHRAQTGLAATILAVSVIIMAVSIFACCTVKKK